MEDNTWIVDCVARKDGKVVSCEIWEGTNSYGDGPARTVGTFTSYDDAKHICDLRNSEKPITYYDQYSNLIKESETLAAKSEGDHKREWLEIIEEIVYMRSRLSPIMARLEYKP